MACMNCKNNDKKYDGNVIGSYVQNFNVILSMLYSYDIGLVV